jgi:hypothetical protein
MARAMARFGSRRVIATLAVTLCVVFARAAVAHDDLANQIAALTAQIAQQPRSAELLLRRAGLYRLQREWAASLADLDRAERLDPNLQTVDLIRAWLYFDKTEWLLAERSATRLLDRQPRHVTALLLRARARLRLGRRQPAIDDFGAALNERPLPDVYLERARAIAEGTGGSVEQSLRSLDAGVARLGPVVTLELAAIDLEMRLNRYDAALARLDRVSAPASRQDTWLARRGDIFARAGRIEEARASYRAALDAAVTQSARKPPSRASRDLIEQVRASLDRLEAESARSPAAIVH